MSDYIITSYEKGIEFNSWLTNVCELLTKMYVGKEIGIKRSGQEGKAVVKSIFTNDDYTAIFCSVIFNEKEIIYSLKVAYEAGSLFYDDSNLKSILDEVENGFKIHQEELHDQFLEKIKLEEEERKHKELEAKKQLSIAKQKIKQEKILKKIENLKPTRLRLSNYYEFLGWAARHVVSIRAEMPDFIEPWFVKRFGDVPHNTVDSNKKTANGFAMKYGLSMCIRFNEDIPENFKIRFSSTNQNKRIINTINVVLDLVENWGFKFGTNKDQNVEEILEHIPANSQKDFLTGYQDE